MEQFAGMGDGFAGLADKVKDINGKTRVRKMGEGVHGDGTDVHASGSVGFDGFPKWPDGMSSNMGEHNVNSQSVAPDGGGRGSSDNGAFHACEADGQPKVTSYASVLNQDRKVSSKFENTLYGYFIGKRLAYPVVEQFARNAWKKYGFMRSMMNGKGFFFFQFDSKEGMDRVLEDGPWMIRNIPMIINVWTPAVSLSKEGVKVVPIWVKLHDVPLVAFSEDGLSLLATKIGKPKRLDGYTNDICRDMWGRSSFARALIEVSSERELKEELIVAIPAVEGEGFVKEKVRVEYEWKTPRCGACKIFGHVDSQCPKNVQTRKLKPSRWMGLLL